MIAVEAEGQAWCAASAGDATRWGHSPTRQMKEPSARREGRALLITSLSPSSTISQRSPSSSDTDRTIAKRMMTGHSCSMGALAPIAAEATQATTSRQVRGQGGAATLCRDPGTGSWGNLAPRQYLSRAGNTSDVSHYARYPYKYPTAPASHAPRGRSLGRAACVAMGDAVTSFPSGLHRSTGGSPRPTLP